MNAPVNSSSQSDGTHDSLDEFIRREIRYDPATGHLWWIKAAPYRKLGSPIGCKSDGYLLMRVKERQFKCHRVAWFLMTGEWPEEQIDHINRDRADNRWANLRKAGPSLNGANRKSRPGRSGLPGAYATESGWKSYVRKEGKNFYLGCFPTPELANAAYRNARAELFPEVENV